MYKGGQEDLSSQLHHAMTLLFLFVCLFVCLLVCLFLAFINSSMHKLLPNSVWCSSCQHFVVEVFKLLFVPGVLYMGACVNTGGREIM